MSLALLISQNAFWIAIVVIVFYLLWKLLEVYLDNEKKINKFKDKVKTLFKKKEVKNEL